MFQDVTARSGVTFVNHASRTSQKYLPEAMTGGVAIFDYDGDGRLDLFFVNGAKLEDPMRAGQYPDKSDARYWNRLYHNNGDGTFTDVTERARVQGCGYGMGVAVGDYNNDGHADLLVTRVGIYHALPPALGRPLGFNFTADTKIGPSLPEFTCLFCRSEC